MARAPQLSREQGEGSALGMSDGGGWVGWQEMAPLLVSNIYSPGLNDQLMFKY